MKGWIHNRPAWCAAAALLLATVPGALPAQPPPADARPELTALHAEFDAWRAQNQPVSPFAALRLQRPVGWSPDWSRTALQERKAQYLQLQGREKVLNTSSFNTGDQIDAAMLGAALARVHWELEVLNRPGRDPTFYLDQSLGSLFELLVVTPEPSETRVEELIRRLHRFTPLINTARLQLDKVVLPLAEAAMEQIGEVDARAEALEAALSPYVTERLRYDFNIGLRAFRQSLATYKDWLALSQERFDEPAAIGMQRYRWFLGHVALVPRSPEALLVESELALARAGAELAVTEHRFAEQPPATPLDSVARLEQMSGISLSEVESFLASTRLAGADLATDGFHLRALPPTLAPIFAGGERIVLTPDAEQATVRYLLADQGASSGLERDAWIDPRLLITWDGIPGRHAQFRAAAKHPRAIRRSAIEASQSEGTALYFHDLVRNAGLYAFQPHSRILALVMLQRMAASAHADLRIAADDWSPADATRYLVDRGGFEPAEAQRAVWRMVSHPGLAGAAFAVYEQLVRFLADAAANQGGEFDLAQFNDRLLSNAHVPAALQRWEYLGLEDELDQLVEQRGRPATVPQ